MSTLKKWLFEIILTIVNHVKHALASNVTNCGSKWYLVKKHCTLLRFVWPPFWNREACMLKTYKVIYPMQTDEIFPCIKDIGVSPLWSELRGNQRSVNAWSKFLKKIGRGEDVWLEIGSKVVNTDNSNIHSLQDPWRGVTSKLQTIHRKTVNLVYRDCKYSHFIEGSPNLFWSNPSQIESQLLSTFMVISKRSVGELS